MSDIGNIGSNETEETPNAHKRPHMSPRKKAFDESLAIVATLRAGWQAEHEGEEDSERDAVLSALDKVSEKITKVRDAGVPKPGAMPKSYRLVGVKANGDRECVTMPSLSVETMKELGARFVSVYGPMHTTAGAEYLRDNGPRPTDNRIF